MVSTCSCIYKIMKDENAAMTLLQSKCSVNKLVKPTNELKYIFLDYMFSFGNIVSDFHV